MRLVELESKEGPVLIEISAADRSVVAASSLGETVVKVQATIADKLRSVVQVAEAFHAELQRLTHIERAEIEFGFGLTAKGSIYVVETEAEATFKVKLSYVPGR